MKERIGIICALTLEAENIASAGKILYREARTGGEILLLDIEGREVVVSICGIGKVLAAAGTQYIIDRYNVAAVINSGIAGALVPNLKIGELVIADATVQHDADTTAFGDPPGLVCSLGFVKIPADARLRGTLEKAAESDPHGVSATVATVATGDIFVSSPEKKRMIADTFTASACEMEGAAVALTCLVNNIPCAVLRVISDGEGALNDYETFKHSAAKIGADLLVRTVKML